MAQYTCNLRSDGNLNGRTEWTPAKPTEFAAGDAIYFTSSDGDWTVQFNDSPFQPTAMGQLFTGKMNSRDGAALRSGREGTFPFKCSLTAGGKPSTWPIGGDDIRTTGK